jgi:dolichol-phosphate mannosyltransferase
MSQPDVGAPSSPRKRLISIAIPVLNEASNVERAYEAVTRVMEEELGDYDYEIVFTDNHSADETFEILMALGSRDSRVRAVRFSKNFGYQNSILTGYALCRGDAAVQLDCDLQDPPELIPEFVREWEAGSRVVYGVRRSRAEGPVITLLRRVFYRGLGRLSEDPLPTDAGDFRLLDRLVIDQLVHLTDPNPYLRGSIAWIGYGQKGIEYDRRARLSGRSNFSGAQLASLAIDGLLAHSALPLRFAAYVGVGTGVVALLGGIGYLVGRFWLGQDWPAGFATLAFLVLTSLSVNAIFLGLIGEYLSRIYVQLKGRPLTIIEESVNVPGSPRSFRPGGSVQGAGPRPG